MHADRTPTERVTPWHLKSNGVRSYLKAMARYIGGARVGRPRQNPVSRKEIHRWYRGASAQFTDFILTMLLERGTVRREKKGYTLETRKHAVIVYYPDGSVAEMSRHADAAAASEEYEMLIGLLEPGETVALIGNGEEAQRFHNCGEFALAA